jgi:hypothetical protein
MKTKITKALILCMLLIAAMFKPTSAFANYTASAPPGGGRSGDPWIITSSDHLMWLKNRVETNQSTMDDHWALGDNIVWKNNTNSNNRIGGFPFFYPFKGTFDGRGYTITMGPIGLRGYAQVGFFGLTQTTGSGSVTTIRNLNLTVDGYVDGNLGIGYLVGTASGSLTIENVHVHKTSGSTCGVYGQYWGGLIGLASSGAFTIKNSSVRANGPVWLNSLENNAAGGLIGGTSDGSTVIIEDCFAELTFTGENTPLVGGIIGLLGNPLDAVTLRRVYSNVNVPNISSSVNRGTIIGASATFNMTMRSVHYSNASANSSKVVGNNLSYTGSATMTPSWTGNTNPYLLLERRNESGNELGSTARGNERWGYDAANRPALARVARGTGGSSATRSGYAVMVTAGSGVGTVSNANFSSGTSHYVNSDRQLTITPNPAPTANQRVAWTFSPAYHHSAGSSSNYSDTRSGNNWLLTARVNGTVSASLVNIPHPTAAPTLTYNQWANNSNGAIAVNWTYNNPQNLTGAFHIYRRLGTSGSWGSSLGSVAVVNGSSRAGTFTHTLAANHADLRTSFQYLVVFVETGTAPSNFTANPAHSANSTAISTNPVMPNWTITATGGSNFITVTLAGITTEMQAQANTVTYTLERRSGNGSYSGWQVISATRFTAASVQQADNNITDQCVSYGYRATVSAFGTTYVKESGNVSITGSTEFSTTTLLKASKGEFANQVRLEWGIVGPSESTFYRVSRRVANTADAFITLETIHSSAATLSYSDNNALTGVFYEYRVAIIRMCSGIETQIATRTDIGFMQAFGTVSGRITYGVSGIASEGVSALVRRNELSQGESQYRSLKSNGNSSEMFQWQAPTTTYFHNIWDPQQFTLQFWIYPESGMTNGQIIGYVGNAAIRMALVSGNYHIYTDWNTAAAGHSAVIPADHFTHVSIVRNGRNVTIRTVNDRISDSIHLQTTTYTHGSDLATNLAIANCRIDFGRSLRGNIDEVRFWNRALTEAEIMRDYSRMLVGNEAGLRGYWTFDDGLAGYAFDMSRIGTVYNGNHSTINSLQFDTRIPQEYQLALKGITDVNGNYQIAGIPYQGEGTSYSIVPSLGVHQFNPTERLRYISPTSMVHNGTDFDNISSFKVRGKVVYAGGNYPVEGVSFEVDDRVVTLANGQMVTSDRDGEFEIEVPIGIHKVRAIKSGHTFANNGLLQANGQNLNYNANVNNIIFHNTTLVKLIGRVTGGLTENDKPLGFGESVNNIGVQTITLESTRQEYKFVTDSGGNDDSRTETFTHNNGQWSRPNGRTDDETSVTYNARNIEITVSSETGEFVAWVYPEPYNLSEISVPGELGGPRLTIYNQREMVNLASAAVPSKDMLQKEIRTWQDSIWISNRPGVVPYWDYFEVSDTVTYHSKWTYYYQATPTFGVRQLLDDNPVNYFGEIDYIVNDALTGASDTLTLWNEEDGYLFEKPLFIQGKRYSFKMNAFEEYRNYAADATDPTIETYPVTSGIVNMNNELDVSSDPGSIEMDDNGEAIYEFTAGAPNLTTGSNSFYATLQLGSISYLWNFEPRNEPIEAWHLGDRTTGTDFMTAGPDHVDIILRDPPGTFSSAYIESGTTVTTKVGTTIGAGLNTALNLTTSLGPKITTFVGLGAGVITENEVIADISIGLKTEMKMTSGMEFVQTTSFTERFETSDDPLYVGHYGDVFVGNSTNILYGLTNAISIVKNYENEFEDDAEIDGEAFVTKGGFSIAPSVSIAYGQTFGTRFVFTQVGLETIMIPSWRDALALFLKPVGQPINTAVITTPIYVSNLPHDHANFGKLNTDKVFGTQASTPDRFHTGPSYTIYFPDGYDMTKFVTDTVMYYNNQINNWIAILAQNEKEKVQMRLLGNYSFGAGTRTEYSTTSANTKSFTTGFSTMLNVSVGGKVGGEVMGIGLELETNLEVVVEAGAETGIDTETSVTTGFILAEDGDDDQITVDYGMTASGTFAFRTRGGRTSCPFEDLVVTQYFEPGQHILQERTMQIEVPKIRVESAPQVINVPDNRAAIFVLAMENESEIGEDVWFKLIVNESTNPDGAVLKIDGGIIGNGRFFLVEAGKTLFKTLTVEKGTANSYENIELILHSQCQYDPTDAIWPSIFDITHVSVEFIPGVSEVAITEPRPYWILNADSPTGDVLNITISNFDVNFPNFGYLRLQQRLASSPNWNTITTFYPSHLFANAQGLKEDIGTRSEIVYPWQMPSIDGAYELRVTAASVNVVEGVIMGNPLSTFTTDAVVGFKDFSRPTALGAPSPADGILGAGDELSITFNEDIQVGMLTQNNFTIAGILNAQEIAEPNVGLAFSGNNSAQTELPLYTEGSFSIETWFKRNLSSAGTLFAYGSGENFLSLGINATGHVVVKIADETHTSSTMIANDETWKFIALTYNRETNSVAVHQFEGATNNFNILVRDLIATPAVQGRLIVGNHAAGNDGFEGALAQLHFYGINRSQADVSAGKSVTKSGREYGLIGYWDMQEGSGSVARDKARSRNLILGNTNWYIYPEGRGITLSGSDYLAIPTSTYPLNVFCDFTLEFWFKGGSQTNATLFHADNGSIGFDATGRMILYRADNTVNKIISPAGFLDHSWHHVAMSVRSFGTVNIYVNGIHRSSFAASDLGSFASGFYYFGAKHTRPNTFTNYFTGAVDEIRIWNSALSREGIELNKNNKLHGNEAGLLAYYPFETYTRLDNGLITVASTMNNLVDGTIVATGTVLAPNATSAVSVKDVPPYENVPFTYVASNNKIVFTLDPNYFARVENTTLNISVKDVWDMRGNKSNTETWTAFVKRNPLQWSTDPVNIKKEFGETKTFTARIINTGGSTVSYAIQNLPAWLSVNNSVGNLAPLASRDLTFTIFQGTNIGNYETALSLASGNGVTEILPVQLNVTGIRPDWEVNPSDFESSMNMIGQIKIEGLFQQDAEDRLAAFIGNTCVGIASPIFSETNNAYYTFISIYGNTEHSNQPITFRLWSAASGRIYPKVEPSVANIRFSPTQMIGSIPNPVVFNALDVSLQELGLNRGWNWVSFNVLNDNPTILDQVKSSLGSAGMMIKGRDAYLQQPGWHGTLSSISEKNMYLIHTNRGHTLAVEGQHTNSATTPISINPGWNWIGYIPSFALSVKDALAGIHAQVGDIIKGQVGFSMYSGMGGWIGSLNFMEAGKGYMYFSANTTAQTLIYPSEASTVFNIMLAQRKSTITPRWSVDQGKFSGSMTITAVVVNDNAEMRSESVEIGAFSGTECRGSTVLQYVESLDKYIGFLKVYGEGNETINLKIYDRAASREYTANNPPLTYATNDVHGNPDSPYRIALGTTSSVAGGLENHAVLNVYPNPITNGIVFVEIPENADSDWIQIYDFTGKLVLTKTADKPKSEINISHLPNGTYIVKIGNHSAKILKQ